jgi:hypothetical protein
MKLHYEPPLGDSAIQNGACGAAALDCIVAPFPYDDDRHT